MSYKSQTAIELTDVSKCYLSYRKPFHRLIHPFRKNPGKHYKEFWALRNVDLKINKGETFGIVGRNGSGKSTLLQVVANIISQTSGTVSVMGKVAAILELGAGFNPEFTGLENVRLNAAILGIDKDELEKRLPHIIEFSELSDFMEKPIKTYSSGMYIRLAFSVAINMNPDVLIIDEALAVGDISFQRKCFRKIEELRNTGVTILLVTHATDTLISLCDRALLLEDGLVKKIGDPKMVVNRYIQGMFTKQVGQKDSLVSNQKNEKIAGDLNFHPGIDGCMVRPTYNHAEYRWGNQHAKIIDYRLMDKQGHEILNQCDSGQEIEIQTVISYKTDIHDVIVGLTIKTLEGSTVFGTNTKLCNVTVPKKKDGEVSIFTFKIDINLVSGQYFFSLGAITKDELGNEVILDRRYDLFFLQVLSERGGIGVAMLPVDIKEQQRVVVNE